MRAIHLLTTDVTGFSLAEGLPPDDGVVAIVVPSNRAKTEKVGLVREAAAKRGLPVFEQQRGQCLPESLSPAEVAISWLYSQILPRADLARYPMGILNMHGGKIPEFRGANVLNWAIIEGEDEIGVTWHELVEEVDAGPIWAESRVAMPRHWTALDARTALIEEGIRLFGEAWGRFCQKNKPARIPDLSYGRVWPSRRPADGRVELSWSERKVRDMVRALCPPWPPARLAVDGSDRAILAVVEGAQAGTVPYVTQEGHLIYLSLGPSLT